MIIAVIIIKLCPSDCLTPPLCDVTACGLDWRRRPPVAAAASHQQVAELHEVEHVALVHLGQLLAELDGLLPHLRRHRRPAGQEQRNMKGMHYT